MNDIMRMDRVNTRQKRKDIMVELIWCKYLDELFVWDVVMIWKNETMTRYVLDVIDWFGYMVFYQM